MIMDSIEHHTVSETKALTVSVLNQTVARLLEKTFSLVWIAGEVSNFTKAASGHWYFTLKDDAAQVRAVMFRGRTQSLDFNIKNGDKIEVRASVTLYPARGDYQLNVETIRQAGIGNLFEAFQRLKEKLAKEGLFDAEKKRPLPFFPRTIGIVTSPKAAALRDVLTTLSRRAPHVRIILYPAPVQGEGAADKIAEAIQTAAKRAETDLLIVCRGGGSMEDLWSFNEEAVARAIFNCPIPIISGVGHETDSTITDFVADFRAPTPTGAAEIATRPLEDWMNLLQIQIENLQSAIRRILSNAHQSVDIASRCLISPMSYVQREKIRLNASADRLSNVFERIIIDKKNQLFYLQTQLKGKKVTTTTQRTALQTTRHQMTVLMNAKLLHYHQQISSFSTQLQLLSPQRTLERGYAIISDKRGNNILSPSKLPIREKVTVRLAKGSAQVEIANVQPELE